MHNKVVWTVRSVRWLVADRKWYNAADQEINQQPRKRGKGQGNNADDCTWRAILENETWSMVWLNRAMLYTKTIHPLTMPRRGHLHVHSRDKCAQSPSSDNALAPRPWTIHHRQLAAESPTGRKNKLEKVGSAFGTVDHLQPLISLSSKHTIKQHGQSSCTEVRIMALAAVP